MGTLQSRDTYPTLDKMNVHSIGSMSGGTPMSRLARLLQMPEALRTTPPDESLVRARRRQIFLAACRVLARKSFHEATVKEIALEAGIAAGSIYLYLQSKDDILALLAESMVAELTEALPDIRERTGGEDRKS